MGGKGNDVYVFNRGDGQDTIAGRNTFFDQDLGSDKIDFGSGILQGDVSISAGQDLIVNLKGTEDQITLESSFFDSRDYGYPVKGLKFVDGKSMDLGKKSGLLWGLDAADLIVGQKTSTPSMDWMGTIRCPGPGG